MRVEKRAELSAIATTAHDLYLAIEGSKHLILDETAEEAVYQALERLMHRVTDQIGHYFTSERRKTEAP
jgi:hypothetical protein